ncbi:hypothetical protein niasHS_006753 [Heterodera schachtii]|uniref:Uncharacterized protein n=1 Tax=Heterodera schachtii TaxID=97005 RepID=A0ABD2JI61_HETSC
MAKLEVQVRHCFCCGLTPGSVLVGLYTLFLYALLTGLAAWALSDTALNGDKPIYEDCELEAQGNSSDNKKLKIHGGQTTIQFEDTSSYHCSIGMYTEEMKWSYGNRYVLLVIALCLYIPLIFASILLLAGVSLSSKWLLIPWLILLPLDILRGLFSSLFIFLFSQSDLARIATGIFFLGLQLFHISLWIIILAKFQRIHYRKHGNGFYDGGHLYRSPQQPYPVYGTGPSVGAYPPPVGPDSTYSPQQNRRFGDEHLHRYYDNEGGRHHRY